MIGPADTIARARIAVEICPSRRIYLARVMNTISVIIARNPAIGLVNAPLSLRPMIALSKCLGFFFAG